MIIFRLIIFFEQNKNQMKEKSESISLILFIASILGLASCKHDTPAAPACVAGSGGNVTVVAYLFHHDSMIVNKPDYRDSVFVKFNTHNLPGTNASSYDAVFVGDSVSENVHLTGLKCGDYYIYGVGLDTITSPGFPFHVSGGIPFSISATTGEITMHVPVTE